MDSERIYRDPELTFAAFTARMGAPEPEVRRLVNQRLGHRHFRSFLNAYRIAEAREALADPARSRGKMAGLAFDVGFASLASFNRAFKLVEGRSPSEFRAEQLALAAAQDGPPGAPTAPWNPICGSEAGSEERSPVF
jgi:AraC-like DNA-binding protein